MLYNLGSASPDHSISLRIRSFLTLQNRCAKATVMNFHWNNTRPCCGKCFSNRHPPRDANSVTAVGLRAGNTRYTFVTAGIGPAWYALGRYGDSVRYSDEYYFYFYLAGTRTNLTGRWWALFSQYSLSLGCWPSGFPINITQILSPVVNTRVTPAGDTVILERYSAKENNG